jgi:hypothetical protein
MILDTAIFLRGGLGSRLHAIANCLGLKVPPFGLRPLPGLGTARLAELESDGLKSKRDAGCAGVQKGGVTGIRVRA